MSSSIYPKKVKVNYEVSNLGNVKSFKQQIPKILLPGTQDNRSYQNISGPISDIPPIAITLCDAKVIRKLASQKVKYVSIAAKFGISISYISLIVNGKRVNGNE